MCASCIWKLIAFLFCFFRWRNHQEHQRAVSCPRGAAEKPAAQHRPQRAHLLHPRHPSADGKGPPADQWENWGRWSSSSPPRYSLPKMSIVWSDIHERTCQSGELLGWARLLWSWWPAGCHQRLNMKNPSNGLNGVHQRSALPSDLACWLLLNTSVVSSLYLVQGPGIGGNSTFGMNPYNQGPTTPPQQ